MSLAHELQALGGDAGRIWRDAEERARSIAAVVHGLGAGGAILDASVERLDRAVELGLRALGVPRGAIADVSIEYGMVMWVGRKDADCTLYLSATTPRAAVAQQTPDDVFRTWVHESLHARQAFSRNYRSEYARLPGYEEGVVEGLAQHLLRDRAGFPVIAGSFDYYVTAYRALAATLGLGGAVVWRAPWPILSSALAVASGCLMRGS